MKGERKKAPLYKVVQVDAWADGEYGWDWNNEYKLFQFRSNAENLKRAFVTRLRKFLADGVPTISGIKEHIDLGRGWYYITNDWDVMELRRRGTDEPVYACIREDP